MSNQPTAKLWNCLPHRIAGAVIAIAVTLASGSANAGALEAESFGWRAREARGPRPLLVIWLRQADDTPVGELDRRKQYYEDLVFGHPRNTAAYPDPLRQFESSVVDYYRDVSGSKFTWTRAGLLGPLNAPVAGKTDPEIARLALAAAAKEGHFDFRKFDTNRDGTISPNELTVLVISKNVGVSGGSAVHFGGKRVFKIPGQDVVFAGGDAVVRERAPFNFLGVINHELFHTLGGIDLYGPWHGCLVMNEGLSLMAGVFAARDDVDLIDLDAWHKMLVGWSEPRLVAMGRAGQAQLAAQHVARSADPVSKRPLLIYNEKRGRSEFFLLEYRTPYRLGYDKTLTTSGLIIWHIAYTADGKPAKLVSERADCKGAFLPIPSVFVRGAPDWQQGGRKAWTSANGEIALRWLNQEDSGVRVTVSPHKQSDPLIEVSWTAPVRIPSQQGPRAQVSVQR